MTGPELSEPGWRSIANLAVPETLRARKADETIVRVRLAELDVQIDQARADQRHALPQRPEFGGDFITPGRFGLAQFSPKLLHLLRQVVDGGSALGGCFGSGTDVDAFAGLADQQTISYAAGSPRLESPCWRRRTSWSVSRWTGWPSQPGTPLRRSSA